MEYDERQAWNALWAAVFGEPPPIEAESDLTARILVENLPPLLPYEVKPVRSDASIRTDEQAAKR